MQNQPISGGPVPLHSQRPKRRLSFGVKFMRIEMFTVLLGIALLLVSVALYAGLASPGAESKQINAKEYQAVFLTNGQVYFGKVTDLNSKYLVLKSVFYIENNNSAASSTTTTPQNSNYTLRKLGTTELHMPEDKMVVNRDTITFWENLKDTSQVVTKINEYYKNPGAASTTPSNSTTQATPTTTTPTTTTPSTTGR
ncbi:MAG: hypothetical protein Q7R60_01545 [bacterium]|nr:hypothetical protein [bacterium]